MTSWFRQAFLVADQAIDGIYAETVTIIPMVKLDPGGTPNVNGRPSPDPTRQQATVQAIFDEPSTQDYPMARGHAASNSHEVGTSKPLLEFTTSAVPYTVQIGDVIVRASGVKFQVSDPGDDSFGRTVLKLTAKT